MDMVGIHVFTVNFQTFYLMITKFHTNQMISNFKVTRKQNELTWDVLDVTIIAFNVIDM